MHAHFARDYEKFKDIRTQRLPATVLLLEFIQHPTALLVQCSSAEEGQTHLFELHLLLKLACTKNFALEQMRESLREIAISQQAVTGNWTG